jgi:hypothetical protein
MFLVLHYLEINTSQEASTKKCHIPYIHVLDHTFLKLDIGVLNMSIFACKTFLFVLYCNQERLMLEEICKVKV